MEFNFKQMDFRSIHLAPYPRRFAMVPHVETIGFMPHKREIVRRSFNTCNLSFILAGSGSYDFEGGTFAVKAPCVLLQWPGAPMRYGPAETDEWAELYLIYPGDCFKMLRASGVFDCGHPPVREITGDISDAASQLRRFSAAKQINADLIDMACWNLIVSSFGSDGAVPQEQRMLMKCREYLGRNLAGSFNAAAMAGATGMSLSSLRRYWAREHGSQTFGAYRDMLLLQDSCRLLVETAMPVKEIAGELGFSDAYYFSRRFHQLSGCTPTAYRRAHAVLP